MRCREAKRLMQMNLAGDATGADHEHLDDHIASCPRCEAQWEEMNECAEAVHTAVPTAVAIERNLASDVLERIGRAGDLSRSSRVRKLAVAATTALIIVVVLLGVLLPTRRPPNLFAAVLEAMAEVKTAHIVTTKGDTDLEVWFSREHGVRSETANYIEILTWEAGWVYDRRAHKVFVRGAHPDAINELFMSLSGASWLARDDGRQVQVSDVVLRGAPAKRVDIGYRVFETQHPLHSRTVWIDCVTMRVVTMENRSWGDDRRIVVDRFRIDYDMPIEPALFTFEPPEGATVVHTRADSKHTETADNAPIEKSAYFARKLIDAVYAGSLRTMADSLDELLHRSLPDWVLGGTAAVLRQQFGTVKNLEFQSIRSVQQFWVEAVWAVIAEHGNYEMKLTFDAEGKVTGVWFRFPPDVEWATATELGVDYVKQHNRETSAQNGE